MPSKNRKNKSKYKKHIHTNNNQNTFENQIIKHIDNELKSQLNLFNLYTNLFWSINDNNSNNSNSINNDSIITTG